MAFDVAPGSQLPWILTITAEGEHFRYTVDQRTGVSDSLHTVTPGDLALCREITQRMLSTLQQRGESRDALQEAIGRKLFPAGLRQQLCGRECRGAGLVIRDQTGENLPWHILLPHATLGIHSQMNLPVQLKRKPAALFLLDPRCDLLYNTQGDPYSVAVRQRMKADVKALRRLFDAADIPVEICHGASITREYIVGNLASYDFVYYLGHAREDGLLLEQGVLSLEELSNMSVKGSPCFFVNGCRSGRETEDSPGIARAMGKMGNLGCVVAPVQAVDYDTAGQAARVFFTELLMQQPVSLSVEKMRRKLGVSGEGYLLFCNCPGMQFVPGNTVLHLAQGAIPAFFGGVGATAAFVYGGMDAFVLALAAVLPGVLAVTACYCCRKYRYCGRCSLWFLLGWSLALPIPGLLFLLGDARLQIIAAGCYGIALALCVLFFIQHLLVVRKEREGGVS